MPLHSRAGTGPDAIEGCRIPAGIAVVIWMRNEAMCFPRRQIGRPRVSEGVEAAIRVRLHAGSGILRPARQRG